QSRGSQHLPFRLHDSQCQQCDGVRPLHGLKTWCDEEETKCETPADLGSSPFQQVPSSWSMTTVHK
ncbi:unnamed protein product, partial [Musa acuminata var. zebrina]